MAQDLLTIIHPDGKVEKDREPDLDDATLRNMLRTMVATRALNERGMNLQRQGRIGFYIGSEGQEACHVGGIAALTDGDWWFPHYRDTGVAIWRGISMETMVHQLYGNGSDVTKGRQMPNHYAFADKKFFSISSPLTTQVPQAVGAAYAAKVRGDKIVTVASFGDGSTSQGDFHVGLNFAAVWKTPTVFLCQNNQWAISVPVRLQTASDGFAVKAIAYGMPGVRVDGNDVLAMYTAMKDAAERARNGGGPTLIEAVTYRMGPHSSSDDPKRYVPTTDLEAWRQKDPIERFREYLTRRGILSDAAFAKMREEIDAEIDAAVKAAEASSAPPIGSLVEDVYKDVPWNLERQLQEYQEAMGDNPPGGGH